MTEKCLQSLIREKPGLTVISIVVVLIWLVVWFFLIHGQVGSNVPKGGSYEGLVGLGVQRQLFWAVVALSSFIGYFEFLGVVKDDRKSFIWLYELIFIGFAFALTASVTRIADQIKWVTILELQGSMLAESPSFHNLVLILLPFMVSFLCLLMWFIFLCLLIDKIRR